MNVTPEQVAVFRFRRSGLLEPFAGPLEAAAALFGVQAQIQPAGGLALWNRSAVPLTEVRVEDLLLTERTLVKLWGQRGTLHMYATSDWPLLHGMLAHQRTWWARRIERAGGDPEPWLRAVDRAERLLLEQPTVGRADLRADDHEYEDFWLSAWGGVFFELVRRGVACHAGRASGSGRFAHRSRWLPDLAWDPPDPDAANVAVARRYLAAFGPSTAHDLAYWLGGAVADAKRWLAALGDEIAPVAVDDRPMVALARDLDELAGPAPRARDLPPRLLYRFDPLLLGHRDKSWLVPEAQYGAVWRPAGHIEATILLAGRIAGTWRYDRSATGLTVTLRPFRRLAARTARRLEKLAAGVAGFFELPVKAVVVE